MLQKFFWTMQWIASKDTGVLENMQNDSHVYSIINTQYSLSTILILQFNTAKRRWQKVYVFPLLKKATDHWYREIRQKILCHDSP